MAHLFQARYRPHDGSSLIIQLFQQEECFGRMTIEAAEALLKDSLAAAIKTAKVDQAQGQGQQGHPHPAPPARQHAATASTAPISLPTMDSMEKLVKAKCNYLVEPLKMPLGGVYSFLQSVPPQLIVRLGRRLRVKEREFLEWLEAGARSEGYTKK